MSEIDDIVISLDLRHCYICKSDYIEIKGSLHVWEIWYKCGCKLWGAIDTPEVYLKEKCPNE